MRRSRTAGEFSGTDESSLSKGTLNETAGRGPRACGGGRRREGYEASRDGSLARYSRQIAPVITIPMFIWMRESPCYSESLLEK